MQYNRHYVKCLFKSAAWHMGAGGGIELAGGIDFEGGGGKNPGAQIVLSTRPRARVSRFFNIYRASASRIYPAISHIRFGPFRIYARF